MRCINKSIKNYVYDMKENHEALIVFFQHTDWLFYFL